MPSKAGKKKKNEKDKKRKPRDSIFFFSKEKKQQDKKNETSKTKNREQEASEEGFSFCARVLLANATPQKKPLIAQCPALHLPRSFSPTLATFFPSLVLSQPPSSTTPQAKTPPPVFSLPRKRQRKGQRDRHKTTTAMNGF